MDRFDFSDYSLDELDYTRDIVNKLLRVWNDAEIALCDAHIRHDEESTLRNWTDVYNALKEVEQAIKARG